MWRSRGCGRRRTRAGFQNSRALTSRLRRLLGNGVDLSASGDHLRLALPVGARDDEEFESEARTALAQHEPAAVSEALGRFTGPYLADDPYSPWAESRRRLLEGLRRDLSLVGAKTATQAGRAEQGVAWLKEILSEDACDEEVGRELIRSYLACGRRSDAVRTFHALTRSLAADLGVDPDDETAGLLESVAVCSISRAS